MVWGPPSVLHFPLLPMTATRWQCDNLNKSKSYRALFYLVQKILKTVESTLSKCLSWAGTISCNALMFVLRFRRWVTSSQSDAGCDNIWFHNHTSCLLLFSSNVLKQVCGFRLYTVTRRFQMTLTGTRGQWQILWFFFLPVRWDSEFHQRI